MYAHTKKNITNIFYIPVAKIITCGYNVINGYIKPLHNHCIFTEKHTNNEKKGTLTS